MYKIYKICAQRVNSIGETEMWYASPHYLHPTASTPLYVNKYSEEAEVFVCPLQQGKTEDAMIKTIINRYAVGFDYMHLTDWRSIDVGDAD